MRTAIAMPDRDFAGSSRRAVGRLHDAPGVGQAGVVPAGPVVAGRAVEGHRAAVPGQVLLVRAGVGIGHVGVVDDGELGAAARVGGRLAGDEGAPVAVVVLRSRWRRAAPGRSWAASPRTQARTRAVTSQVYQPCVDHIGVALRRGRVVGAGGHAAAAPGDVGALAGEVVEGVVAGGAVLAGRVDGRLRPGCPRPSRAARGTARRAGRSRACRCSWTAWCCRARGWRRAPRCWRGCCPGRSAAAGYRRRRGSAPGPRSGRS